MEDINIALLIDADNISSKYVPLILSELSKYGKITIRRMYGDWTQDRLHSWMKCSAPYSLTPVMQPNNTPGKNASDIGLIIDAMDILYGGDVQGFCIVSSDGDFNKLATRLREAGKVVIGMGEKKTPESFRVSCERFIFLDIIAGNDSDDEGTPAASPAPSASSGRKGKSRASARSSSAAPQPSYVTESAAVPSSQRREDADQRMEETSLREGDPSADSSWQDTEPHFTAKADIESAIVKMITDNNTDGKETGLGEIGSRLVKIYPDFDIRNYNYIRRQFLYTNLNQLLFAAFRFFRDNYNLAYLIHSIYIHYSFLFDNAVWVSLKSTPDSEIEKQIQQIFARHKTNDMNISALKSELSDLNPNLDASIRKSGVTRFSVYLNRNIHSVEVNGRHVTLK